MPIYSRTEYKKNTGIDLFCKDDEADPGVWVARFYGDKKRSEEAALSFIKAMKICELVPALISAATDAIKILNKDSQLASADELVKVMAEMSEIAGSV